MKWLIILLLILLLLVLWSRYRNLEEIIRKVLNLKKYRLPNEIIVDMASIPEAKHQDLVDWFIANGYKLKRRFSLGSSVRLHLLARKNTASNHLVDLLTSGKDGVLSVAEKKVELDGGSFDDVGNNFLVLFPSQRIKLPNGLNIGKLCREVVLPSKNRKRSSRDQKDVQQKRNQENNNKDGNQSNSEGATRPSSLCMQVTRTLFKPKIGNDHLNFVQGLGAKTIRVALIDSKVAFAPFAEFGESIAGDIYHQYINNGANKFDGFDFTTPDAHGTFMASIICDKYTGDSKLLIRNYPFHDGSVGNLMELVVAIYSACEAGVDIVNLSLGYQADVNNPHLKRAIEYAGTKNVLVICASGNTNTDNDKESYWPANFSVFDHVLSVAAVDFAGVVWKESNEVGSNVGELSVNLSTDGDKTVGFINDVDQMSLSGTSCSAAHLSAIACNIISANEELSAIDLKTALLDEIGNGTGIFPSPS